MFFFLHLFFIRQVKSVWSVCFVRTGFGWFGAGFQMHILCVVLEARRPNLHLLFVSCLVMHWLVASGVGVSVILCKAARAEELKPEQAFVSDASVHVVAQTRPFSACCFLLTFRKDLKLFGCSSAFPQVCVCVCVCCTVGQRKCCISLSFLFPVCDEVRCSVEKHQLVWFCCNQCHLLSRSQDFWCVSVLF